MIGLPKPDYRQKLNYRDAINSDIITTLENNFAKAVEQTKGFSENFKSDSKTAAAYKLWKFLKNEVTYKKDDENQLIKLPARLITGDKEGDCKSFALTSAAVLYNLGITPVTLRFANYKGGKTPTHVYATGTDEKGKKIIVDPVYKYFDSQKPPTYYFDKTMKVYTLSGVQEDVTGIGWFGAHFLKEVGKGVKKIGLAVPRRAFRTYVALNIGGSASKLHRALQRDPGAVKKKWESLGGNLNSLKKSVGKGKSRKRIFGIEDGIGEPVSASALIAAATPIIVAFFSIFKKGEQPLPGETPDGKESTIEKIISTGEAAYEKITGKKIFDASEAVAEGKADPEPHKSDEPSGFNISPAILIGLGALGLMLLLSKRK